MGPGDGPDAGLLPGPRLPGPRLPGPRLPGPDFPASAGASGATCAHLNAAAAYDLFRDRLGRNDLDGKGGPIVAVVDTSAAGRPYSNACWDGEKMV
ncbi:hypothetical protein [Kitasatospora purpeofusca]|uniref:hypothetical protein n=1 Tax=Kitasatospora purpeofusca TaxID=67352 RepID=UPI002A5AC96D|nr:hypothetical protein [Kitasatospora purpeofusca]MDY0816842.1 hypothetical protein [Kitasatospora purpeofusca]